MVGSNPWTDRLQGKQLVSPYPSTPASDDARGSGGRQDMHQNPGRTNRSTEAKVVERDTAGQGGNHPTPQLGPPLTLSFMLCCCCCCCCSHLLPPPLLLLLCLLLLLLAAERPKPPTYLPPPTPLHPPSSPPFSQGSRKVPVRPSLSQSVSLPASSACLSNYPGS